MGIRGARIEAAELELGTEHLPDQVQNSWRGNQPLKDFSLIHQIGKTPCSRLFTKFRPGILAFQFIKLLHPVPDGLQCFSIENVFDQYVPTVMELLDFCSDHTAKLPHQVHDDLDIG